MKKIIVVLTLVGFVLAGCSSNFTDSTNANTESTTNKEVSQVESSVEDTNQNQQDTQEAISSETNNSTQENPGNNGINAQIPNNLATSLEEAVNLFKGEFPDAILTSIEIDNEKGVWVYDLDGYSTENEYEMVINSENSEILRSHSEIDRDDDGDKEINITNTLSVQDVLDIAEKESITNIENLKLENEVGKDYWTIEGFNPEIELVLDAITGEIVARDND
ncbi:MAG: hypothetical protein GYA02_17935 [Clostridiaceae bacterium]|nr:hypothetical protein [Clostridiaceae bacterium]